MPALSNWQQEHSITHRHIINRRQSRFQKRRQSWFQLCWPTHVQHESVQVKYCSKEDPRLRWLKTNVPSRTGALDWWQAETWNLLRIGTVEWNVLAQRVLQQFTRWPWIAQPTNWEVDTLPLSHCRPNDLVASTFGSDGTNTVYFRKFFCWHVCSYEMNKSRQDPLWLEAYFGSVSAHRMLWVRSREVLQEYGGTQCCRYLHHLELLRQAQGKDSNSGH